MPDAPQEPRFLDDPNAHRTRSAYPGELTEHIPMARRFYSFRLLHTPASGRILAYWLMGIFAVLLLSMFLPWQQSIRAGGYVTAFSPSERPQKVYNAIGGLIERWQVQEGDVVRAGDTILTLREIKDKYFDPLTNERLAAVSGVKAQGVGHAEAKLAALDEQLVALREGLSLSLEKARYKIAQTGYKVSVDSAELAAARNDAQIAATRAQRQEDLHGQGLTSLRDVETARLKVQETTAKARQAQNKLDLAHSEVRVAWLELSAAQADYQAKIAKAAADRDEAAYKVQDARAEWIKAQNEQASTAVRSGYYVVRAPQDGRIIRALRTGLGEMLKEGEPVVTIMPARHTPAVELYVNPSDIPLLQVGGKVRMEFDGFPALQVSGWPSVSVGTFGGRIAVVDFVNSKNGKYRILVVQDEADERWPKALRIGSGVYGWALLDQVPVWYEVWRQINRFPPSLQKPPNEEADAAEEADKPATAK